jgi:hypothetical protein
VKTGHTPRQVKLRPRKIGTMQRFFEDAQKLPPDSQARVMDKLLAHLGRGVTRG